MEQISYKLPVFEGPMDLLLHLINKHKLNINDIPIFELVTQYIDAVRIMKEDNMDVASEFVEMASRLIYIKTVSLLPVHEEAEELKKELQGELIEYRECKLIAEKLSKMTGGFDYFTREPQKIEASHEYTRIHEPIELLNAYMAAVGKGKRKLPPSDEVFKPLVQKRIVPVHAKISFVLRKLRHKTKSKLSLLFSSAQDKSELVATFLAVLELARNNRVFVDGEGDDASIRLLQEETDND